jgi:hypothetical protein
VDQTDRKRRQPRFNLGTDAKEVLEERGQRDLGPTRYKRIDRARGLAHDRRSVMLAEVTTRATSDRG